jgi:probable F420-dependent oxidoreductase
VKVDLAPGSLDPRRAAEIARAAEAAGFDGLWLAETEHDPFLAAGAALAATHRLEVGTGVAVAFARSPIVIAQTAFDLAALGEGRFQLGLGTQVRGHVERRFGMPWSAPAPRLAEWIGAIRATWAAWQEGRDFRFRSEHFDLSLMPDFFRPPPLPFPPPGPGRPRIPISIAGVGPGLARLAGRLADGFQVHPFHTARYLAEVLEPALAAGAASRDFAAWGVAPERIVPVFLVPAEDARLREEVRRRIAFYASTPTYRGVLRLHAREAVGERLSRLAVTGRWSEMPALIDDALLAEVAVVAPAAGLGAALAARVAGHAERVVPILPFDGGPDGRPTNGLAWDALIEAVGQVP